ncbi:MAG: hypothetical protein IJ746_05495 [Ruminococcus sp.]|nr:hypothetical protein [Ruminococcus sp.]
MGRAGRGGGGGGSRGGSFGGSRGFSSRSFSSSSHRSSYSSGRSHHSSYHPHHSYYRYNSGPKFYYFGGSRYSGGYSGGYSNNRPSAFHVIKWVAIILLIIIILAPSSTSSAGTGGSITRSTVDRDKLESTTLRETTYYIDDLGWITNSSTLESGMKHFYKETGVFPMLIITDNDGSEYGSLEKYANAMYDKHISDDAHVLVLFCEKNEVPQVAICVGQEAMAVIDEEARQIMLDYLESYYYSDYDENQYFSKAFSESADRIMRKTPSYGWIAFIFILIIVVLIILFRWWKKKKKQKLDEMQQAQNILNSDLHEFGETAYSAGGTGGSAYASPYSTGGTAQPTMDSAVYPEGYTGYGSGYSGTTVDELKAKYDK